MSKTPKKKPEKDNASLALPMQKNSHRKIRRCFAWAIGIFSLFSLVLLFSRFGTVRAAQTFSMKTGTVLKGSTLLIDRWPSWGRELKEGDWVVYKTPPNYLRIATVAKNGEKIDSQRAFLLQNIDGTLILKVEREIHARVLMVLLLPDKSQ